MKKVNARRGARKRHEEEGELVVPEVRVDPRFRQYWRDGHYPSDVPSLYGTHYDTEWHFDEATHDWVPAEERPLRVMGAANWSDVWPEWPDVGKDYHLLGPDLDQPLDPIQMKMLKEHCGIRVKFEKKLGGGTDGLVYKVQCRRRVVEVVDPDQLQNQPSTSRATRTRKHNPTYIYWYMWEPAWDAACKIMRFHTSDKNQELDNRVDKLLLDFLTLRYFKHENIVQMLDLVPIPDSDTHFPYSTVLLLMEVCDGALKHISNKCTGDLIPHVIVKKMMRDVCTALQFMHNENAVHLDIKPENILFSWNPQGNPLTEDNLLQYVDTLTFKLGDLGSCMTFNPDEPAVIIPPSKGVGTPFYMSYEMKALKAETRTDEVQLKPCDIFSLGVTLAECVMDWDDHNDNVKKGDLTTYMADKAKLSPNECPPGMTPLLASLIHSMIKKDPKDRPTIEKVLNHEWLREGTSRKRKEKSQSPDKKKFGRYRWHASI